MASIGVIGLGAMGAPMSRRLARAGHTLAVCDANEAATAPFRREGITVVDAPSGCAGRDIVLILVPAERHVREVIAGPNGLLDAIDTARPPVVVLMSTVLPELVREISGLLSARNVTMLDAPISGGVDGAEAGTLTLMVGGEETDLARVRPVLEVVGRNVISCGPIGSGAATKIINNIIGVTNWLLMAEAMALASRAGMDLDQVVGVMELSSGRNSATKMWPPRRESYRNYAVNPMLVAANQQICRKDIALALELAARTETALPITSALLQVLETTGPETFQRLWAKIG